MPSQRKVILSIFLALLKICAHSPTVRGGSREGRLGRSTP